MTGSATVVRLPTLATALEELPPSSQIHVHVEDLNYIDHACIDLLTNWNTQHEAAGGTLTIEWDALTAKYRSRGRNGTRDVSQPRPDPAT